MLFTEWEGDIAGLISNNITNTSKDKICYIITEKRAGESKKQVYSSYAKLKKRIKKLEKLNASSTKQYNKCKACRKKKLITTSKIKVQIEKLNIPDGKMSAAVKLLVKNYIGKIVAKQADIKCSKFDLMVDNRPADGDEYTQFGCENYVIKNYTYTWKVNIATFSGAYPKTGSKRIHFKYIVKDGIQLDRGFKATKKGKRSSNFKKYSKKVNKHIKSYKKSVAKCNKCKKRAIAKRTTNIIGWAIALFPNALLTHTKYANAILKKFNKAYKKKSIGCKNAKFSFVKATKAGYCNLTCAKVKHEDKTLEAGDYIATFKK